MWADGSIDYKGMNACCEMQIRPAIWIDFSDDTEMQELKMRNWREVKCPECERVFIVEDADTVARCIYCGEEFTISEDF